MIGKLGSFLASFLGQTYAFLQQEKKTWIEHDLQYDGETRAANLRLLKSIPNNCPIKLCYTKSSWGGLEYQHWFVVVGNDYYIEFGAAQLDIYAARVNINTQQREYIIANEKELLMNDQVRQRISHVLGICNYSLCLRNCEHVANYIVRERWHCDQVAENGVLINFFKKYLLSESCLVKVNTFPSCIRPHVFGSHNLKPLYSFIKSKYIASRFDYYLDSNEETFNILMIGPSGAGKSHLINVLFNQKICASEVSHRSVTKEIYFIRGHAEIFDIKQDKYIMKKIVIADTIGLCDTEWSDQTIIDLIKARISSNFRYIDRVYVVFKADRLPPNYKDNILKCLKWLQYERYNLSFVFVGTYADYLDDEKKKQLAVEFAEIFRLGKTDVAIYDSRYVYDEYNSLIYTGFPPENYLSKLTRLNVIKSYKDFVKLLTYYSPDIERVPIETQSFSICSIL